ncbi:MAG: hypothetical protein AB7S77_17110 [Desulfatirhabdiaceae bacterium]
MEHALRGQNVRFLNFDIEINKSRFLAAASLPPADALRSLDNPDVLRCVRWSLTASSLWYYYYW